MRRSFRRRSSRSKAGWKSGCSCTAVSSPYRTPGASVRDPAAAKGSAWKAVLAGIAINTGGTFVASAGLLLVYGATLMGSGVDDPQELQRALMSISLDSPVSIAGMLVRGALSVAGGYACARIARRSEYALGAIIAVCGVLAGFYPGGLANFPAGTHPGLNTASIAS